MNYEMWELFEEHVDLDNYIQISQSDVPMYDQRQIKYVELYSEDHYPIGRALLPKSVNGKSLIRYLYQYSDEIANYSYRSHMLDAILEQDFSDSCFDEFDMSVINYPCMLKS